MGINNLSPARLLTVLVVTAATALAGLAAVPLEAASSAPPSRSDVSSEPSDAPASPVLETANSTTVENPDGSFTTKAFGSDVNYLDDQTNTYLPIRSELVPVGDEAYTNRANSFEVTVPREAGTDPVALEVDGISVSLKLAGLSGAPDVSGATAIYDDLAGPATSAEYEVIPNGIKESILLESPPSATQALSFGTW